MFLFWGDCIYSHNFHFPFINYWFNYIDGVSTFPFFLFVVSTLFLFNQLSKLFYFFYFSVSTIFLFNQISKIFDFSILMSQFYFYSIKYLNF